LAPAHFVRPVAFLQSERDKFPVRIAMLAEDRTRTREELRKEFSKMQRAQFIIWLTEQNVAAAKEIDQAEAELEMGKGYDWQRVREEINQRFDD
jgi:hypothetical protein